MLADIEKQKLCVSAGNGLQSKKAVLKLAQDKNATIGPARQDANQSTNHSHIIIDCRFSYEFRGGHIKGAVNISDPKVIETLFIENRELFTNEEFLKYFSTFRDTSLSLAKSEALINSFKKNQLTQDSKPKEKPLKSAKKLYTSSFVSTSTVDNSHHASVQNNDSCTKTSHSDLTIVFYCEFSSKRAPDMYNHLRKLDRKANAANYPSLFYSQLFLLENGFSGFVKKHKAFCTGEGRKYVKMSDVNHELDFKRSNKMLTQQWNTYSKGVERGSGAKIKFKTINPDKNKLFFKSNFLL